MMGMKDRTYWFSWFLYYTIIILIISVISTIVLAAGRFKYTNWFLLFLFYFLWGMSIFAFGIFMASLFYKAMVAVVVAILIYFAMYFLGSILLVNPDLSESVKTLSSLLPCICVTLGVRNLVQFEVY